MKQVVPFTRTRCDNDFHGGSPLSTICADGLFEYVDLPRTTLEINVVFTDYKPIGEEWFEMAVLNTSRHQIGLLTKMPISWYDATKVNLAHMYSEGFRYVTIQYVPGQDHVTLQP